MTDTDALNRFTDRVVLITGAGSGIGRATALRLAAEGAIIVGVDVNEEGLAETVAAIVAAGGSATAHVADVSNPDACRAAVDATVEVHGRLDVLANIAGVVRFGHAADLTDQEWRLLQDVNLSGPWFLMQAALPHLEESGGNVVNLASAAGVTGQAYTAAYCASKGGLVLLTKAMAVEFAGRGVRFNAVCPGMVNTPLNDFDMVDGIDSRLMAKLMPLMAGAEPEEIATLVAYLASDEARYVTGAAISIDGGQTAG
jgi:meso-butanediol dehydrogenase/(S,S)-butanediol dehydrogenase/diacetyl reductase